MKQPTVLLSLGVLTALLVFSDAGRYHRNLDRSEINKTNEEVSLLKKDVLDHITSTLDPTKSVTKHSSKTEATNHVTEAITEAPFRPVVTTRETEQTGEQLQKIPEDIPSDSHVEEMYERKVMLQEDNPQTESSNIKNESMFKDYSNYIKYKFNQSSPSLSMNSEVTISHTSYEHSSVVYSEEEDDDYYTPVFEHSTKSTHSKNVSKKKKKESLETVTVPISRSTAKPLTNKVEQIKTDALDERQSTTNRSSLINKFLPDNNSLDFSTTISNKDNTLSQSGKIVINDGVNSDENIDSSTKKPRMTFSVKKTAVINDTTASPDTAKNTVPVLKWEKARTLKPNIDKNKEYEKIDGTEKSQIDSPKSLLIKPSIDFKNRLGLSITRTKNTTVDDISTPENSTDSKSTAKPITSFKERKRPSKLVQFNDTDFAIPPTSTAWVGLATLKDVGSNRVLNPSTDKTTTQTASGKVKEFVPWSTRLQRATTTQLSAFNTSTDGVTVSPKSSTVLDSDTSSSWNNLKVATSELTSTETDSVMWTTTELERNSTEGDSNENSTVTEEMMSDDPSVSEVPRNTDAETPTTTESFSTTENMSTTENISTTESISTTENISTTESMSTTEIRLVTTTETFSVSPTPFRMATISANILRNNSQNGTAPLDMNQTSNELITNETLFDPKLSHKIDLKHNETVFEVPKEDIDTGLDDKIGMDDFDDELKKETTHFDLPTEATTAAMIPESEEDSRENDNDSERDEEEVIIEKPKRVTLSPHPEEDTGRTIVSNKTILSEDSMNVTQVTEVVTGNPHEGGWYNVSVDDKTTTNAEVNKDELLPRVPEKEVVSTTTVSPVTKEVPVALTTTGVVTTVIPATTTLQTSSCSWEVNPPAINSVDGFVTLILQTSWPVLCQKKEELRSSIINMYNRNLETCQVLFFNINAKECSNIIAATSDTVTVYVYFVDAKGKYDETLVSEFDQGKLLSPFKVIDVKTAEHRLADVQPDDNVFVIAVGLSCLIVVGVLVTAIVLLLIRKRRKKFNYGQRCTPVSLDDYSLDNISVYNSVRRKSGFRASKRSYGNPAFDDPSALSHPVNFAGLANLCNNREALDEEFSRIPIITLKPDELPPGAETKNRYANVIPLPETRVQLSVKENADVLDDYINANYVKGPKAANKFYIACQGPLQSTVTDFWRMIWQEQCKVILMLTALQENGVEKCADYLPPSQVIDCHCLFGDFQVTLKKHEVREKYLVSTLQIKNLETNSWREVIHLWYSSWPATGVPHECSSMISYLLEAHSYMRNSTGPTVVHCSPGTGRTGTVLAIDLCIREFESCRTVDIPKTVYALRRDRAGAVQTKDQYAFIYQALNLYATKLTGGALDSI